MVSRILLIITVVSLSIHSQADCVVLLHGLARTDGSMRVLEKALTKAGYEVQNIGYPSTKNSIEELATNVIGPALGKCGEETRVHFVTHSLGGILVRQYLVSNTIENLARGVMLGPPNKGSEVVDKLARFPSFHFINGDAGLQLGTGKFSKPNQLGGAAFDLGIIAGTSSINPILSSIIEGVDDGKVSVESTRLEGMNDHIVLPVTHTFMMRNKKVVSQVVHYLQHGEFRGDEAVTHKNRNQTN